MQTSAERGLTEGQPNRIGEASGTHSIMSSNLPLSPVLSITGGPWLNDGGERARQHVYEKSRGSGPLSTRLPSKSSPKKGAGITVLLRDAA